MSATLALTLDLAEALVVSELLEKTHLIRRVTHHLCRNHSLAFATGLALHVTVRQAFPCTSSDPSLARLRQPAALSVIA